MRRSLSAATPSWGLLLALTSTVVSIDPSDSVSTTQPSLWKLLCSSNVCRNGECYVIGNQPKCVCDDLFTGDRCQYVNLKSVDTVTIGCTVIFQWKRPPRLRGYSFVYFRLDSTDHVLYKNGIYMKDNDRSTLVGKLDRQNADYRVCLEDEYTADLVVRTKALDNLNNCVVVRTEPDYHTLVAYIFAAMLGCVVVILIYYQRDKLELLFFSKPMFLYTKPKPEEEEEQQN
ncbi:hypothetical protein CAPTEDRAFT_199176 [Capitella teleta]|uniref:EGF-like domain-containing protein n=1 Tax=Capitella teleta TaxID=283909 RepID=R7VD21_CAPTE|nr:hypothetical protein CAPTEDRAFT_199176 [Capitella teleta]|eukprot:ELU16713.1 hypothetical protein CAPTEDRAFT_199176 [Capitella teleta]